MTAIIVIACLMMYLAAGGYTYSKVQAIGRPRCKYSSRNCDAACGHSILAGLSVLIWPAVIPIGMGIMYGGDKSNLTSRTDRRRQKEIDEALHKKELARIAMEEDALLTHQLESINRRK